LATPRKRGEEGGRGDSAKQFKYKTHKRTKEEKRIKNLRQEGEKDFSRSLRGWGKGSKWRALSLRGDEIDLVLLLYGKKRGKYLPPPNRGKKTLLRALGSQGRGKGIDDLDRGRRRTIVEVISGGKKGEKGKGEKAQDLYLRFAQRRGKGGVIWGGGGKGHL